MRAYVIGTSRCDVRTAQHAVPTYAIQSHQKRRSMRSSSRPHKKTSYEKPYRAGQFFAGPPSRAAQVFSSFLKK
jgi:hypothetical protein